MAENVLESAADGIKVLPQKSFKYKKKENGQFLKIHNTIRTETGEKKRLRFCFIAFNCRNDGLVGVDSRGNIFIFNLNTEKFSILNEKILECTILKYLPHQETQIIFGTRDGQLQMFDTYTGANLLILQPFQDSIENISFSEINPKAILISTKFDAIIYDLNSFEIKHKLEYTNNDGLNINKISFIPKSNQLFCCFNDNSIHIWDNCSFKELTKIYPIQLREKYLIKSNAYELNLTGDGACTGIVTDDALHKQHQDVKYLFHNENGQIAEICFSSNGKFICLSTVDNYLILLSIQWEIIQLIHLTTGIVIKQCEFLSSVMSSSSSPNRSEVDQKIITPLITTSNDIILLDWTRLNDGNPMAIIHSGNSFKFILSKNSNMLGLILCTGEIIMYDLNVIIKTFKWHTENYKIVNDGPSSTATTIGQQNKKSFDIRLENVNDSIRKTLPRERLVGILKEYDEYPMKYRTMIWKAILELPQNTSAFCELLHTDLHVCTENFDNLYPIVDVSALRNLKRITSCLAHWNRIFGQCTFLPNFIFPFVKLFEKNLISCFETIATLLINHCQLWFEFGPLSMPINYLGMIENCLSYFEPELIEFYCAKEITNETYAWSILKTAYTEILNDKQWYQLWDNIVSNRDVTFLLFTIVAYNSIQKSKILQLKNEMAIKEFFQYQNSINMKKFIQKSYAFMMECPDKLHPKHYIKPFKHLLLGNYQPFTNYPKTLIASVDREMNALQDENKQLNKKLYELEKLEIKLDERFNAEQCTDEHAKRLRAVEQQYLEAVTLEEQRVAYQRKQLLLYQRQLREQERALLMDARKNVLKKNVVEREQELEDLLKRFDNARIREDSNLLLAEEDLKIREMKLLLEKYKADMTSSSSTSSSAAGCPSLSDRFNGAIQKLNRSKSKLNVELDKIKQTESGCDSLKSQHVTTLNQNMNGISHKINYINDMLKQMQLEFQRLIQSKNCTLDKNRKIKELQWQISQLENEVKKMLETATNI